MKNGRPPRWAAALLLVVVGALPAVWLPSRAGAPAWADGTIAVDLKPVGHTDVGAAGPWDGVAVVGTTALVSSSPSGGACGPSALAVVDLGNPKDPRVVTSVTLPEGLVATGLDAKAVSGPTFTGDLAAVAVRACSGPAAAGGVLYYDVSDPAAPKLAGRTRGAGAGSVSIGQRGDGRTIVAAVEADAPAVDVDEVTDPARPVRLGRWARPAGDGPATGCPVEGHAEVLEGAVAAFVAFSDGGVYSLDLADSSHPSAQATALARPGEGRAVDAAVVPVGRRTIAVVSEENTPGEGCSPGDEGRGLRLLAVEASGSIDDVGALRLPSPASPAGLVASGELAYVAWRGEGLRVVDLGQVRPTVVAQFVPGGGADFVGAGLLPADVIAVDRTHGLYVLERPEEGQPESFWSKLKNAAGYIGFAGGAAAIWLVPRLAMGRSPAGGRVPSPAPTPAGGRRPGPA